MKKLILLVMIAAGVLLSACAKCNCEPDPEDEAAAQARVEAILCDM